MRVDGNSADAQLVRRAEDTNGDFTSIGDEYLPDQARRGREGHGRSACFLGHIRGSWQQRMTARERMDTFLGVSYVRGHTTETEETKISRRRGRCENGKGNEMNNPQISQMTQI